MAPKFKGDEQDWLDDESGSSKRRARSKPAKKGPEGVTALRPGDANGTVAVVFPKLCRVRLDGSGLELLCSYRRAEVFALERGDHRERSPVAVGDRVLVEQRSPDSGLVQGICERRNFLSRRAPGRENAKFLHVVAANVDEVVIVGSVAKPEFNPGLIDRYLVACEAAGIPARVVVTKMDLHAEEGPRPWTAYSSAGYPVHEICTRSGLGVAELRAVCADRTIVFAGLSGVGKTSLLNALIGGAGGEAGKVGEISDATGKGRHTTTAALLLRGPGRAQWIDTPGVREFGLAGIEVERLWTLFPEFRNLACSGRGCQHFAEADCEATALARHGSYLRIFNAIQAGEG